MAISCFRVLVKKLWTHNLTTLNLVVSPSREGSTGYHFHAPFRNSRCPKTPFKSPWLAQYDCGNWHSLYTDMDAVTEIVPRKPKPLLSPSELPPPSHRDLNLNRAPPPPPLGPSLRAVLPGGPRAAGAEDDGGDVVAQLGVGGGDLAGEDVAEGAEGGGLAAHELVLAADELDELARVDVWVAAAVDVGDELEGHVGERGATCAAAAALGLRLVGGGVGEAADGLEGGGELGELGGEDLAGRGRGVGGGGGGRGEGGAGGGAVAVGGGGRGGVGVVVGDLDHGLVEDLDHVLELACLGGSAEARGDSTKGKGRGWSRRTLDGIVVGFNGSHRCGFLLRVVCVVELQRTREMKETGDSW